MKSWPALSIVLETTARAESGPAEDLVSAALDDFHPTAIQESPDSWLVFFRDARDRDAAAAALAAAPPVRLEARTVDVPDEDWARRSQENLTPVRVGRITIAPPWAVTAPRLPETPGGNVTIVIQPSMGFGTGHHATTRLCAALLQRLDLAGRTVLDVGTGSGVLALVARALGARRVIAVDDDPDAIESARENLALNGGPVGIDLRVGDFRALAGFESDVVTANLTGGLLVRGAGVLAGAVATGGHLIVSGVTLEEEAEVLASFAPWLTLTVRLTEDEWMGALLEKR